MNPVEQKVVQLVLREARLIDDGAWAEWLALFAPDGSYWIPRSRTDTDPALQPALLYEDAVLLKVRVERLQAGLAHSLQPEVRCLHVLQAPELEALDDEGGTARVHARYVYLETQSDQQVVLGCTATYHLVRLNDTWRIAQKVVRVLNPGAPLPMIQLMP